MGRLARFRSRPAARAAVLALEIVDRLTGRHESLVPPRQLLFVGGPQFREIGQEFRGHMIELGGLRPSDRVLDIGCGVGRMAVPLLGYLESCYEGFDVAPAGIAWCRRNVTPRDPRFHFKVADLRNDHYSPRAIGDAAAYRFPYPDGAFDFALAVSVFTHLLPGATRNYLRETRRVLRSGGTLFSTFFLLDDRLPAPDASFTFDVRVGDYHTADAASPESAIAYERDVLEGWLGEAGLSLHTLHPGTWTGLSGTSFQDIAVIRRSS